MLYSVFPFDKYDQGPNVMNAISPHLYREFQSKKEDVYKYMKDSDSIKMLGDRDRRKLQTIRSVLIIEGVPDLILQFYNPLIVILFMLNDFVFSCSIICFYTIIVIVPLRTAMHIQALSSQTYDGQGHSKGQSSASDQGHGILRSISCPEPQTSFVTSLLTSQHTETDMTSSKGDHDTTYDTIDDMIDDVIDDVLDDTDDTVIDTKAARSQGFTASGSDTDRHQYLIYKNVRLKLASETSV